MQDCKSPVQLHESPNNHFISLQSVICVAPLPNPKHYPVHIPEPLSNYTISLSGWWTLRCFVDVFAATLREVGVLRLLQCNPVLLPVSTIAVITLIRVEGIASLLIANRRTI